MVTLYEVSKATTQRISFTKVDPLSGKESSHAYNVRIPPRACARASACVLPDRAALAWAAAPQAICFCECTTPSILSSG
jgi:hypothetical protein